MRTVMDTADSGLRERFSKRYYRNTENNRFLYSENADAEGADSSKTEGAGMQNYKAEAYASGYYTGRELLLLQGNLL